MNVAHNRYKNFDIALIGSLATSHTDEQILNYGCSCHIYLNRKFFSSLKELEGGFVYIDSGTSYKIKGIDKVQLKYRIEQLGVAKSQVCSGHEKKKTDLIWNFGKQVYIYIYQLN